MLITRTSEGVITDDIYDYEASEFIESPTATKVTKGNENEKPQGCAFTSNVLISEILNKCNAWLALDPRKAESPWERSVFLHNRLQRVLATKNFYHSGSFSCSLFFSWALESIDSRYVCVYVLWRDEEKRLREQEETKKKQNKPQRIRLPIPSFKSNQGAHIRILDRPSVDWVENTSDMHRRKVWPPFCCTGLKPISYYLE